MPPEHERTLNNLQKERRRIWRGLNSGKLNGDIYRPILGKTLDLILVTKNRLKNGNNR